MTAKVCETAVPALRPDGRISILLRPQVLSDPGLQPLSRLSRRGQRRHRLKQEFAQRRAVVLLHVDHPVPVDLDPALAVVPPADSCPPRDFLELVFLACPRCGASLLCPKAKTKKTDRVQVGSHTLPLLLSLFSISSLLYSSEARFFQLTLRKTKCRRLRTRDACVSSMQRPRSVHVTSALHRRCVRVRVVELRFKRARGAARGASPGDGKPISMARAGTEAAPLPPWGPGGQGCKFGARASPVESACQERRYINPPQGCNRARVQPPTRCTLAPAPLLQIPYSPERNSPV